MKMSRVIAACGSLLLAASMAAAPAQADMIGMEGCTPGYWKNHPGSWQEEQNVPYDATTLTLRDSGFVTVNMPRGDLMMAALNYGGGPGAAGAERILLRAAAAAWLNAATEELGYPLRRYGPTGFIAEVNTAIASGDRAAMLELATMLDEKNNLGCTLS